MLPEKKPQWFWVAATFKAVHESQPRRRHLWEKTVFLIQASDEHECRAKAIAHAEQKQHSYFTASGSLLSWVFQEIEEVQALLSGEVTDGTEVYWQFFERVDKK
jgi:hypothetical protein